ncbi:MAG TPA: lipocalin family protein [Chitinophagaceae bacterium]|nr:lipocalin family protein [Chitinophagaceae bacterium]
MQKQRTYLSLLLLGSLFSLTQCSKDNDDDSTAKTNTELITQSTWKFSDAKVGGASVSAFLKACEKDNTVTLAANGTGIADEGGSKCDVNAQQSTPFTWTFQSNETVLNVSTILFTGGSSTFTIVSLSESTLVVSQDISVSGSTQNAVVTFVH